jgi:hypothetical protein
MPRKLFNWLIDFRVPVLGTDMSLQHKVFFLASAKPLQYKSKNTSSKIFKVP